MKIELTSEQRQAMRSLRDALTQMQARGLGVHAIAYVLDETFSGICNEIGGGISPRTWGLKTDPYYHWSPGQAAESAIVPGTE
jgi:hypothetical protein